MTYTLLSSHEQRVIQSHPWGTVTLSRLGKHSLVLFECIKGHPKLLGVESHDFDKVSYLFLIHGHY